MIKNPKILITLNDGREIRLELYPDSAPITVENFLKLVNENYYDGLCFHRIISDFMIQGGGYKLQDKKILEAEQIPSIIGEFSSNGYRNNIKHTLGVISMARTNVRNSATSQFFICAATCPHLDGSYAAFGSCVDEESKKVVSDIADAKTEVLNAMFTDFPSVPVIIESIKEIKE